jgi:hypothetical protein
MGPLDKCGLSGGKSFYCAVTLKRWPQQTRKVCFHNSYIVTLQFLTVIAILEGFQVEYAS